VDATPDLEVSHHAHAKGPAGLDEILEDSVGDVLVERSFIAEGPEVELQGFQLQAQFGRGVCNVDGGEIGLPRSWAKTGELGALEVNLVLASRSRVREHLQAATG